MFTITDDLTLIKLKTHKFEMSNSKPQHNVYEHFIYEQTNE